ncbi:hypothetical protein B0T20DRAFT_388147 [Sordaria brevicollis]|uniref:Uncharacterized protein n=1 Tax=Sordaria brevicollis TaxID=83679 RepID=A0AAE0UFS4_SORBR|nr:hypothetical protein B0T20DRAFT_388147 [Sordaria brevicollis]
MNKARLIIAEISFKIIIIFKRPIYILLLGATEPEESNIFIGSRLILRVKKYKIEFGTVYLNNWFLRLSDRLTNLGRYIYINWGIGVYTLYKGNYNYKEKKKRKLKKKVKFKRYIIYIRVVRWRSNSIGLNNFKEFDKYIIYTVNILYIRLTECIIYTSKYIIYTKKYIIYIGVNTLYIRLSKYILYTIRVKVNRNNPATWNIINT